MKAPAFEYIRAHDASEAVRLLGEAKGHARPLAGGQSLGPMLNLRLAEPDVLVGVHGCEDLQGIIDEDDAIVYGAGLTHAQFEDGVVPDATGGWLAHVARRIAYRAVRNRGTLGGSIAHADPAADWLSVMLSLQAQVIIQGPDGLRIEALEQFVTGPFVTTLASDEIVVAVRVDKRDRGFEFGYQKFSVKHGEFAHSFAVFAFDRERDSAVAVLGAIERVPLVFRGSDAWVDNIEQAEALLAARLPRLTRAARRMHCVNLVRAVTGRSRYEASP